VDNPWDTKLPFKNAIIDYKISGTLNGEKTIYVKDYGRTTAEYSTTSMKIFGMVQEQKEIIIVTPDWEYTIDLVENTGTKQANPKKYLIQEFNNLSKTKQKKVVKNSESLGISTIEGMDGTFEKNAEKIMGYQCDKVSMAGVTTIYLLSGTDLPLRIKGNNMGMKFNQDATIIKTKGAPASKFKLPSNIQFEHNKQIDQMMQDRAKTIIQSLVDGTQLKSTGTGMQMGKVPAVPAPAVPVSTGKAPTEQDTTDLQDQMKNLMNIFGNPKE
jgi:hypothetical protein